MERIINEIENLKRVIRGSRPNVKYTQIMNQIGVLEREVLNLLPTGEVVEDIVEEGIVEDVIGVWDIGSNMTIYSSEIIEEVGEVTNYENLSLSELRELFPDIKATSKEAFLLKINNPS